MQIELQPEHMKGNFSQINFENLDEITAANEAAHRALIRKRFNVVNGFVHGNMLNRFVKYVPTKLIYHTARQFGPETKALHSFMDSVSAVRLAARNNSDYRTLAESAGVPATGDRFQMGVCSWWGGQSDVVAKAILNYHDPYRDGHPFPKGWLVHDEVIESMINQVQDAAAYQGNVTHLQQNPDVA